MSPLPVHHDGQTENSEVGAAKPPPRSKLACKTCRAIKVRCIRPPESNAACARCSRYGLQCNDPPVIKRKGRPPNSSRRQTLDSQSDQQHGHQVTRFDLPQPSPPKPMGDTSGLPFAMPLGLGSGMPNNLGNGIPTSGALSSSPNGLSGLSGGLGPASFDMSQSQAGSGPGSGGGQQAHSAQSLNTTVSPSSQTYGSSHRVNHNLNMAEFLDPTDTDMTTLPPKAPFFSNAPVRRGEEDVADRVKEGDDPVSLRALSEVEANSLVLLFHSRLNPLVAVLDPNLHTMPYLRHTSSVLFSTVLAAASRFFRHDLHSSLLSHARTVLDRALQAGSTDIGVVQSLMILTYWKDPEDTSGWMKVGMAIRLGYSLFWHIPRTDPLPDDEREAREKLNAERTWFCLFSFERGQSYVHGLPTVIRLNDHSDPEVWAREHMHFGPSVDMHIAASMQLCKLKDHWGQMCEPARDPVYLDLAIETLLAQGDAMIRKYFNKEASPPCFDQDIEHVLLWSILDFMFVMKRFHFEMLPQDPLRLDACIQLMSRVADEIDIVASNGQLVIMQDSASCMTSGLVAFIRKIFRFSTRAQKSYILQILHRVHLAHASVTNEDSKTAPAYVARYIRRVLSALSAESRAPSPGPDASIVNGGLAQDVEVDFFAELGLEEFMHVPEYVAQNEADDGRYWANMLLSEVLPRNDM